jgi:hypothetical protein
MNIIAPMTYRQRSQQSTGRDPLRCPHWQHEMGCGASGIRPLAASTRISAIARGNMRCQRHARSAEAWTNRLVHRRRHPCIAARFAVKRLLNEAIIDVTIGATTCTNRQAHTHAGVSSCHGETMITSSRALVRPRGTVYKVFARQGACQTLGEVPDHGGDLEVPGTP